MRNLRTIRNILLLIMCAATVYTSAQTPNGRTTRQARTVVNRLMTNTAIFQQETERNRYTWDNATTNADGRLANMVTAFSNALSSLQASLNTGNDSSDEVSEVLNRANRINLLLTRNQVNSRALSQWAAIRTDVNTLAGYYNMPVNWNAPYTGRGGNNNYPGGGFRGSLTGTYRLNTTMSDNVPAVLDRSVGYYSADQRDRMRRGLERRLTSPDMIVIDKNGRTIMMASSLQPQVTFDADGVARTETNARGRTITTTVTSTANGFTVNYAGDRVNDFNVTFDTDRDGRLRVTRRIYLENRNETVTATSVYDRINDRADWTAITPQNTTPYYGTTGGTNEFYIPNGVSLTATLRNAMNTRASQVGDRFTLDVVSPNQYRGAVIEGHVSQAANSGRVSGRASMQLDFDTITVNGRQYAFAGMIDSVSSINGDSVTVNNEGTIRDNSQTNKTVTRAGIGALLGAVIGAVAGGGQERQSAPLSVPGLVPGASWSAAGTTSSLAAVRPLQ